ncbi:MAG: ribokinase [bacterium]
MNNKIIVVGSINMDLVIKTKRIPNPGETVMGESFYRAPGGKGANQAVAISKLGGNVHFIGKVGLDPFGNELTNSLVREGVDVEYLLQDENTPTGVALIIVDESGENTIVVAPGANMDLEREDIDKSKKLFSQAKILLTQLEIPLETVKYSLELARNFNMLSILNPAPARSLTEEILSLVDIITPNELELKTITGKDFSSEEEIVRSARSLLDYGIKATIVTLGGKGALCVEREDVFHISAIKVNPVDTTAAGDAFNGALALKLSEGSQLKEAVSYANVVAGITVTRKGAQPSIPYRKEVEDYIKMKPI